MPIGRFMAGTSGLVLPEPNKKAFPEYFQDKSRLVYYSSLFNSIEVNSSFYKIPRHITYRKWADEVPMDFSFTIKLWKGITHTKKYDDKDLDEFFHALSGLTSKKGCLLIQYPASSQATLSHRECLLKKIRNLDPDSFWLVAVEIRNKSWMQRDYFEILETYGATIVMHDLPGDYLRPAPVHSTFRYLRFHGPMGDYRGSYEDYFLKDQAIRIQQWRQEGLDVYAYFNNTIGDAVENLKTLISLVG